MPKLKTLKFSWEFMDDHPLFERVWRTLKFWLGGKVFYYQNSFRSKYNILIQVNGSNMILKDRLHIIIWMLLIIKNLLINKNPNWNIQFENKKQEVEVETNKNN